MTVHDIHNRSVALALGIGLLLATSWAQADPPSRVARLGYADGPVSFSPAGQSEWVQAAVNRPLTTGDRLWVDANARAELQIGGAAMRLGGRTDITVLNLDDNIAHVQLAQGALRMRVRSVAPNQSIEIDTPNLAFTVQRAGDYRIDVDPQGDATAVAVDSGEAQVLGAGAAYTIRARQGYRFRGTGLSDYETLAVARSDELDRWALERDRRIDNSVSARYVSMEVVGYEDLDANGIWRADPSYGYVWTPTRVAAGWTPYRDGHWAWVDPWGWTWVDAAPWGYAVSHYGRWAHINNVWCWVPGPPHERAVYAPALVAFPSGTNFQPAGAMGRSPDRAGWRPLAPHEVYRPAYRVSRGYFDNVNRSNAAIAPATISNIYNTHITNEAHGVAVVPAAPKLHPGGPGARAQPPSPAHGFVARSAPPAAQWEEPRRMQLKPSYPAEAGTRYSAVTAAQAEAARTQALSAAAARAAADAKRHAPAQAEAARPEVSGAPHHARGSKSESGEKREGEKRRADEDGRRH